MIRKTLDIRPKLNTRYLVLFCALCLVSCFFLCSFAPFSLISSYPTKANAIAADNFGNFYSSSNNSILKFSADGEFLYRYEEFRYGKMGMFDASNPLKIVAFYPDFMTVVFLDRFLSPLNTYSFFDFGYQYIPVVSSSTDGRVWFYDITDFRLKKIDHMGKIFLQSQQLNVLLDKTPNPNFMLEYDNKVYMSDTSIGVLVFDIFGSYEKTIPLKGLKKFQVSQGQLIFFENNQLNSYNSLTLDTKVFPLPDTSIISSVVLAKDRLAILRSDRIDFYKY